jgi:chromosome segregation ATPase
MGGNMENYDINGRIESFDQSVRSLDRRLRAVERRLSASKDDKGITLIENVDPDQLIDPDIQELRVELKKCQSIIEGLTVDLETVKSNDLNHESIHSIQQEIRDINDKTEELIQVQKTIKEDASAFVDSLNNTYKTEIQSLKKELDAAKQRIQSQENINKISIGSIKVPVELSGIIASIALIVTGYLVWADRWDIIRSTYFPSGLALLFAVAVIVKFIITNRQPKIA